MKFYVASALANYKKVISFQNQLNGSCSFDWAECYRKQIEEGLQVNGERLAVEMYSAILSSDHFILYCPGRRGAHVEFGIAYEAGIRMWIYNPHPDEDIKFYFLPNVRRFRTEQELIEQLNEREK